MWDRIKPVSEPDGLPVTIGEAKAHARANPDADDDPIFERLIRTAVAKIEGPKGIGVALLARQWQLSLHCFPRAIVLPLGPVTQVNAIAYVDPVGDQRTLEPSDYHEDLDGEPAVIEPAFGKSWPATLNRRGAVTVTFTAGYADAAAIPDDLKSAILMTVAHLYENREHVNIGNIVTEIPDTALGVFERYRVGRFGA